MSGLGWAALAFAVASVFCCYGSFRVNRAESLTLAGMGLALAIVAVAFAFVAVIA
jgi:hypothetical protein